MRTRVFLVICVLFLSVPLFAATKDTSAGMLLLDGRNIDVLSWSWGVSQSESTGTGSGGSAGKATFTNLTFTKKLDKSSSDLIFACASGKHIPQAVLTVVDDKGNTIGTVLFGDVLVSQVTSSGSGGDTPTESISLNFAKVEIKY